MSMQMLSLLGLGLVAIGLTLEGCGGGGHPPSPTPPTPPAPAPPGPTPPAPSNSYKCYNTTLSLGAGVTLSGDSSASVSFDVTKYIVEVPSLQDLYKKDRDEFTPDAANLIDAVIDAANEFVADCTNFLRAMSDTSAPSLTTKYELKNTVTLKSSGSMFPRTYYPCIKVLKIDFDNGYSLMGLNSGDIFSCSQIGTHGDEVNISMIV